MSRVLNHIAGMIAFVVLVFAGMGCRQKMGDQPRYEAYEATGLFSDSLSMRPPPEGTVSRESALSEEYVPGHMHGEGGGDRHDSALQGFPFAVTKEVLLRGRERFDIYCSPCHGRAGDGRGMIVERGLRRPPSFHSERLRNVEDAHYYAAITNGFGAMFSYAARVAPADRWAIVAYVRALQLSRQGEDAGARSDTRSGEGR